MRSFFNLEKRLKLSTVDVIIPTYKPGKKLEKIIEKLENQTYPINKIILINTEEKYFTAAFGNSHYFEKYGNVMIKHISKMEFDHAGTRRLGVTLSNADYFIFMTDDAIPLNNRLVEELIAPLERGDAVLSYARQCARKKSSDIERFTRKFNYPDKSMYKSLKDKKKLGIKTYFCSDVCAAYNRIIYDSLGGLVKSAIFNEDMLYAAKVIENDYTIYYSAEAKVEHSHLYTNIQQLKRNFDMGVSQAKHPEVFASVPSTKEGIRLVKDTAKYLAKRHKFHKIPGLYVTSAYKYIGFWLGKHYRNIPMWLIKKLTMNECYWLKGDDISVLIDPHAGYGRSKEEKTWNRNIKTFERAEKNKTYGNDDIEILDINKKNND